MTRSSWPWSDFFDGHRLARVLVRGRRMRGANKPSRPVRDDRTERPLYVEQWLQPQWLWRSWPNSLSRLRVQRASDPWCRLWRRGMKWVCRCERFATGYRRVGGVLR